MYTFICRRGPGQSFTGSGDAAGFRGGVKRPRSDDDSDDVPKTKKMKNGAAGECCSIIVCVRLIP